jgi:hypothetical protein
MQVIHRLYGDLGCGLPMIWISRASDGFMLSSVLAPNRAAYFGPFPSAIAAERAGITLAEASSVQCLTVVCDWLNAPEERIGSIAAH